MVLALSPISTDKITTSSAGAFPQDFMVYWSLRQYNTGTVGAENIVQSESKWIEDETLDSNMLQNKLQKLKAVIGTEPDDVLIDESIPYKPLKSFKIKAKIGNIRHVKVSHPLFDAPEDYLIDE